MHPVETLLTPLGRAFRTRRADESRSVAHDAAFRTEGRFTLSSPAFPDGGEIPARCCGWLIGGNVSPALTWGGLPAGTVDLLLLVEDLDSPGNRPRLHAVAAFVPAPGAEGGRLPEGALAPDHPTVRLLTGRRGPRGWAGPRPLPGHGPHRYRFHLFALAGRLDLDAVPGPDALAAAVRGHVLASGTLTGVRES